MLSSSRARRLLVGAALTASLTLALGALAVAPAQARKWPGHPDRNLVTHVVRPGDTATGLSVRRHAWTREFIRLNGSRLRVGQRVTIPVVVSAVPRKPERAKRHRFPHGPWRHADMSRAQIRRLIARQAKRHGVPVRLAQAVGWQESGWHQPLVSSAGAIGVMQVLPSTGRWMSALAGEKIRIRDTHGNVRAGTMLLRVLLDNTRTERAAVAAYYEGLAGIRDGWYQDTRRYVRSVMAIKRQLVRTGHPVR